MLTNKWLRRILLTTFTVAIVGCASEEDTIIMAPVPVVESQFTPSVTWSHSVGDGVGQYFSKLTPAYAYGKVFVASRDGDVVAFDATTGDEVWSVNLEKEVPARLSGGIKASYGQLFIGTENGELISLDAESGEEKWRSDVDGEVLSVPETDANLVLVHTTRGALVALEEETGNEKWTVSTEVPNLTLRGTSSPVAVSGGVFWGTANGRLAAAIVERGQMIWQQPVGTPKGATEIDRLVDSDAQPLIVGGMLYTIGINGQLVAIDLRSGSPAWKRNYSSARDMATDGRNIYLVTDKDYIVAVDARSGTELWQNRQLEYRLLTAPAVIDRKVVLGDSEGYLYWLDRNTGEFISQQMEDDSGFAVAPLEVEDGFIITTRDGSVKMMKIN
ncbi:outer membrane protein assembly factor BamB [Vibrio sp. UCD-FRSSP16_10]|uniref:outer membrane protein assembly factor BamB n=1 Tax=unclassified Vibrio TaxID=2614977 RepID=UPI0007FE5C8B|nr:MULTISPECIES: outer membrane protein assembly factor BamB [unclassified Vibrio]OBT17230.1 outer membrane protein assembly factor BamB [Vibrio sp. UCD-FRSSP16_30]OBT22999.1 outer membrane protein assembly factor BamB [Vibrio sp. UCD-FRSSP16_10]